MTATFLEIENKFNELAIEDAKENNQTAIKRARKLALELRKLLHTYRLEGSDRAKAVKAKNKAEVAAGTRKQRPAPKRPQAASSF